MKEGAGAPPPRDREAGKVHLVPHTHWDREWYLPFQRFRLKLVRLVDRLLDAMEADERYRFTLDGQLATLDDYLEVRPEAEPRVRRLVEEGRLAIGPWQVLMDEFLVSGETIVRNLEQGQRRGAELGGAMAVGYLPDMFGHVAQMPQILRQAGIEQAVVWRGVPAAIDRHAFEWEAPDGSSVRAEYLPYGYGNGAYLLDVPGRLGARLETIRASLRPFFGEDELLAMYGTDHMEPVAQLADLVEESGAAVELSTLPDYLASLDGGPGLPRWRGELRSSARANMLMGTLSARLDLKAAMARAERALTRYAEPFQALYGSAWPERLLDLAWRRVLDNSAHDSICGCSVDEVSTQVLVRCAEAEQIGMGLAEEAARVAAAKAPLGTVVAFNPSPCERLGLVELELAVPAEWDELALELPDGSRVATQELTRNEPLLHSERVPGGAVSEWLRRRLHGRELFARRLNGMTVDERRITFEVDDEDEPMWLDIEELKSRLEVATQRPDDDWEVRIAARARRTVVARVPAPPLGWNALLPVEGSGELEHPAHVGADRLDNGLLAVAVAADGTLTLNGLEGVGRLVDGGDAGDSYNFAPPEDDNVAEEPDEVRIEIASPGPVRGELRVVRSYRWGPQRVRAEVTTTVELRAGEPFVRLRVSFDNPCDDHRLRFHVPLRQEARFSAAEGQFAVVERGLEAEAGFGEVALPTFPAYGFVDAGGVSALLDHPMEYELVGGRELALTILRSTGLISRSAHAYRESPAGPEIPIPAAQCRGPWSIGFALYPHDGAWHEAGVHAQ
ncbi:MAG TPA: glycoside hydrolase family 38 C-terminal domain-containing protein, partial [Gaiellaceae bacterium]|nr:glycoside hydrolase family 38 C-terminal domain-containing protein [Gaiellaceae bacterium]